MASCKGPRGRRPGVKTVPDRGLTSAQALQPLAQLRQKSPKASIVRGSLRSKKRPRRTLRSGRGSRTNSNTSRQIPARVIDAGYLPVAPENLVRRHSRGEEEIIASSNTTLVIIRLARNEHISSAIHPKAEAIATCRDFAFVPIARRGGLLEPSRRNLVISGAFALETERFFYRGSFR